MIDYYFHKDAETELLEAIDYYENCSSGLGYDFSIEAHATVERICSFPKAWPTLVDDIRRCQLNRFPFGILYIQEKERIYIIAVMHLNREPNYWHERIE